MDGRQPPLFELFSRIDSANKQSRPEMQEVPLPIRSIITVLEIEPGVGATIEPNLAEYTMTQPKVAERKLVPDETTANRVASTIKLGELAPMVEADVSGRNAIDPEDSLTRL
jgi:hypothetical protein